MDENNLYKVLIQSIENGDYIDYESFKSLFMTLDDYEKQGLITKEEYRNAVDKWWEVYSTNKWGYVV